MFLFVLLAAAIASAPPSQKSHGSPAPLGRSEPSFDLLLRKGRNGDIPSLRALSSLRVGSDGARAEAIDDVFSAALETNPAEVLRLIRAQPKLYRVNWICEDRDIEPSRSSVARYNQRVMRALRSIHDTELRRLRDQCLTSVGRLGRR